MLGIIDNNKYKKNEFSLLYIFFLSFASFPALDLSSCPHFYLVLTFLHIFRVIVHMRLCSLCTNDDLAQKNQWKVREEKNGYFFKLNSARILLWKAIKKTISYNNKKLIEDNDAAAIAAVVVVADDGDSNTSGNLINAVEIVDTRIRVMILNRSIKAFSLFIVFFVWCLHWSNKSSHLFIFFSSSWRSHSTDDENSITWCKWKMHNYANTKHLFTSYRTKLNTQTLHTRNGDALCVAHISV